MKPVIITSAIAALLATSASAETLLIETEHITYAIPSDKAGDMAYSNGTQLEILGKTYQMAEVKSMTVTEDFAYAPKTVLVTYSDGANVLVDGEIARYVDITVTGGHVSVAQSADVSDTTCGELTYALCGSSDDASFSTTGSYKATVELSGLQITNPNGAALDIQNGKRIKLKVIEGTSNSLTDGASGGQKGCIVCKGHMEIAGKGSLTVTGNTNHGIFAKEYITLKNADITVNKSVKDALNCNQYFTMESGNLTLSGIGDDAIQVSFKDETNREAEDTGCATISGGSITATITAGGKWDSTESKTKSSSCLKADGDILISGGTINFKSTGSGGKGIKADGTFTMEGGSVSIATTGGLFAYSNGTAYDNYTGSTDRLSSNYKSSPKGVKIDGNIFINDGSITVTTTGNGGEGIESKSQLTINGGKVNVKAYDDGINSSSHMYINGGDVVSIGTSNDGIDSNGNLYIAGGTVQAFGANSPECGLDANEEGGYKVYFTGGYILAKGGSNSVPSNSQSTQPYVTSSSSVKAGDTVTLKSGDTVLASFVIPDNYSSSSSSGGGWMMAPPPARPDGPQFEKMAPPALHEMVANGVPGPRPGMMFGPGGGGFGPGGSSSGGGLLISCPGLVSGQSYTLTIGTTSSTVSAVQSGSGSNRPF